MANLTSIKYPITYPLSHYKCKNAAKYLCHGNKTYQIKILRSRKVVIPTIATKHENTNIYTWHAIFCNSIYCLLSLHLLINTFYYNAGVLLQNSIVVWSRFYSNCGRPKPWEDDKIKAYALCPWFAETELVKETTTISKLEKKSFFRVLTVEEVGNAFEQSLDADDNGSVWIVFPDAPATKYPEMSKFFLLPIILYAKIVAMCRPEWRRINGLYGIPLLLLVVFCILYLFLCTIF